MAHRPGLRPPGATSADSRRAERGAQSIPGRSARKTSGCLTGRGRSCRCFCCGPFCCSPNGVFFLSIAMPPLKSVTLEAASIDTFVPRSSARLCHQGNAENAIEQDAPARHVEVTRNPRVTLTRVPVSGQGREARSEQWAGIRGFGLARSSQFEHASNGSRKEIHVVGSTRFGTKKVATSCASSRRGRWSRRRAPRYASASRRSRRAERGSAVRARNSQEESLERYEAPREPVRHPTLSMESDAGESDHASKRQGNAQLFNPCDGRRDRAPARLLRLPVLLAAVSVEEKGVRRQQWGPGDIGRRRRCGRPA